MAAVADTVIDLARTGGKAVVRVVDGNGRLTDLLIEVRPTSGRVLLTVAAERTALELGAVWLPLPKE